MSATEESTDRRVVGTLFEALGDALAACAAVLVARSPEASRVWAAAARTLLDRSRHRAWADSEAEVLLLEAATDPLAPPWLVVDGLIALIVEHLGIDDPPDGVVEVDRSLAGLRRLSGLLRGRAGASR